jgi:hypothetical protein
VLGDLISSGSLPRFALLVLLLEKSLSVPQSLLSVLNFGEHVVEEEEEEEGSSFTIDK